MRTDDVVAAARQRYRKEQRSLELARTRRFLQAQATLLLMAVIVSSALNLTGLATAMVSLQSAVFCGAVALLTLGAWLAFRYLDAGPRVVPALLYADSVVALLMFYLAGEFETPALGILCLATIMAPLFASKRTAYRVATVQVLTYSLLLLVRQVGWLPYGYMVPPEAVLAPGFVADCWFSFVFVAYGVAVLAGGASIDILNSQQRLLDEVADKTRELAEAQTRSDSLLKEVLPGHVADSLLDERRPIAEQHDSVTVLFADVVGFCRLAAQWEAVWVVDLLNRLFTEFDEISARHGLEKIKTIGDAYMAAAGLPDTNPDHVVAAVEAARDMIEAARRIPQVPGGLQLRIGIHTGPVVAGVIGDRRPAYDLWGDTVNVASRMESLGRPGQVRVSETSRRALDGAYRFREGGTLMLPGRAPLRSWLVDLGPLRASPLRPAQREA